jgi:hypothetical protein
VAIGVDRGGPLRGACYPDQRVRAVLAATSIRRTSTPILEEALATPYIGDFDVVFAGGGASTTVHQQEKTR